MDQHEAYAEHGVRPPGGTLLNQARARAVLAAERLDGLLATMLENVYYLSNFWCENLLLLPYQTQCYAVVSGAALDRPIVGLRHQRDGERPAIVPADDGVRAVGTRVSLRE